MIRRLAAGLGAVAGGDASAPGGRSAAGHRPLRPARAGAGDGADQVCLFGPCRLTPVPVPPVLIGRDLSRLEGLSSDDGVIALAAFDGRRVEVTPLSRARFGLEAPPPPVFRPAGDCAPAAEAWISAVQDGPIRRIALLRRS